MFLPLSFHELKGVEKDLAAPAAQEGGCGWFHRCVAPSLLPSCIFPGASAHQAQLPPPSCHPKLPLTQPSHHLQASCGCPQLAFPSPPFLLPQPSAWQMVPAPTPLLSQEPGLLASSLPYSSPSNQRQSPFCPLWVLSSPSLLSGLKDPPRTAAWGPGHLGLSFFSAGHQLWDLRLTTSLLQPSMSLYLRMHSRLQQTSMQWHCPRNCPHWRKLTPGGEHAFNQIIIYLFN